MAKDEAPILLHRHCEVHYEIRSEVEVPKKIKGTDLEAVTKVARELLSSSPRVWVDVVLTYHGQAANEEAKIHAGKREVRVASFEVFAGDLVHVPAGAQRLDPRVYKLAEAAQGQ